MYGSYKPAKTETIHNRWDGRITTVETPAGYSGLLWGTVHHRNGRKIKNAQDYFMKLAETNGEEDEFAYWNIIGDLLSNYCREHIRPLKGDNPSYGYQCGFGGDESDGLIDFWLPVKVPKLPNLKFVIKDKMYTLRWDFTSGDE